MLGLLRKFWASLLEDPEQARMERYLSQAVDHAHLDLLMKQWAENDRFS